MIAYESYYGAAPLGDQESIQHYGVLGMKWGQRRFQNKDGTLTAAGKAHEAKTGERGYTYKSHGTKKYDKKAVKAMRKASTMQGDKRKKLIAKAKKYQKWANRSRELDKREQQYAKRVSAKGNIASRYLTKGVVGGKAYQQTLAMLGAQNQKKRFTKEKVLAAVASNYGGRLGSALLKSQYMKNDKVNTALNAYAKKNSSSSRKKKRR